MNTRLKSAVATSPQTESVLLKLLPDNPVIIPGYVKSNSFVARVISYLLSNGVFLKLIKLSLLIIQSRGRFDKSAKELEIFVAGTRTTLLFRD